MSDLIALSDCRPHDLLGVAPVTALVGEPAPAWVPGALAAAPLVVVRRAPCQGPLVPVGVRGAGRSERYAAFLPVAAALRLTRPEDLVATAAWRQASRRLPHFAALESLAKIFAENGMVWGPVGGVGFELASGRPVLSEASDIDLLIRAPVAPGPAVAHRLLEAFGKLDVRIDAQLAVPAGAVALAEYVQSPARMVLRAASGPRLVSDPWQEK